jgi:hypothetical protein
MNEDVSHIDKLLLSIEQDERERIEQLRSPVLRGLGRFDVGDAIVMSLIGVDKSGKRTNNDGVVAGRIANPDLGLIQVKYTKDNVPPITGRLIGLATKTTGNEANSSSVGVTYRRFVAGGQRFAYYLADDMILDGNGERFAPANKIEHPALKYGRMAINGVLLFDLMTPEQESSE